MRASPGFGRAKGLQAPAPLSSVSIPTYALTQPALPLRKGCGVGAHVEGPFLNPEKKGAHDESLLRGASNGVSDLLECYGKAALLRGPEQSVRLITVASEVEGAREAIPWLRAQGIVVSQGMRLTWALCPPVRCVDGVTPAC